MSGKPYHSCLIPFEQEILLLRRRRRPASFAHIADVLREKHQICVRRETIFKFIKVRSRGRKVYAIPTLPETPSSPPPKAQPPSHPEIKFEFKYSDRYNLKRLPPEEAAAIRKKLEAEGH